MILGPLQCAVVLVALVLYPDHIQAITCENPAVSAYRWTLKADTGEVIVVEETLVPEWTVPSQAAHLSAHVEVYPVTGLADPPVPPSRSFVLRPCEGDLNYDGFVGTLDFLLLGKHWGKRCDL